MDTLKKLVHGVASAFYDSRVVVILDALANESRPMREDVIARRLKFSLGVIRKILAQLQKDQLVRVDVRHFPRAPEARTGPLRCWRIDFARFLMITRYRLYKMQQSLHDESKKITEEKEYICPQCLSNFSLIDLVVNPVDYQFYCSICDGRVLEEIDNQAAIVRSEQRLTTLTQQLAPLTGLVQEGERALPKVLAILEDISKATPAMMNEANKIIDQGSVGANSNNYAVPHDRAISIPGTSTISASGNHQIDAPFKGTYWGGENDADTESGVVVSIESENKTEKTIKSTSDVREQTLPEWITQRVGGGSTHDESVEESLAISLGMKRPLQEDERNDKRTKANEIEGKLDFEKERRGDGLAIDDESLEGDEVDDESMSAFYTQYYANLQRPPVGDQKSEDLMLEERAASSDTSPSSSTPMVQIGDRQVLLTEINEEDLSLMTSDEYAIYYEKLQEYATLGEEL